MLRRLLTLAQALFVVGCAQYYQEREPQEAEHLAQLQREGRAALVAMEAWRQGPQGMQQHLEAQQRLREHQQRAQQWLGTAPRPAPPAAVPPPVPAVARPQDIPLAKVGGVYELPVEINGVLTLHFVLDSGAAEVNMPADVVLTLIRTGTIQETDFLPGSTYVLADGSTLTSPRFLLRSLKIGQVRIANVVASVGSPQSPLLLGQSMLEKLGPWGIDPLRRMLIIRTPPPR